MIQNSFNFGVVFSSKNSQKFNFGQNAVVSSPQKDSFSSSAKQEEPKKTSGILPTVLMLGGSSLVGVFAHKIIFSSKVEKELQGVKVDSEKIKKELDTTKEALEKSKKDIQAVAKGFVAAAETVFPVTVKEFEQTALHVKFAESQKSLLGFIQEAKEKPEEMKEFLFGVTSHPEKSQEFIKEVIADPRQSREITQTLVHKVGGQKNFIDWYFAKDGYQEAYAKHVEKTFAEAKKPDDLFKISPNWQYYKVTEKFGNDFTAGELPKAFENIEKYRAIVGKLLCDKELPQGVQKVKEFPAGLSDKRAFLVEADGKKYVLKVHHDFEEYSPELKASNEALLKGEKTSWLKDHFFKIKENEMMKSDSGFVNAQIDSYLKHNNSPNVANVYFFDNKSKSSLYELAEGESLVAKDANIVTLNQKLPDLNNLGIIYNDINLNNFKVKDASPKIIDSGESSYIDVLRPGCSAYHFKSPNLNGLDLSSCIAGINLDKINE